LDNLEKRLEVLFDLQKYDELLKLAFENVYADKENELLIYTYIIIGLMNTVKHTEALKFANETIGKYPETSYIIYLKAKLLLSLSQLKEASKTIKEALSLNANDADYYLVASRIYFESSNFVEAKKSIDKALEIDSSNLDFHIVNAMALYMLDAEKIGREIIDEVLQKDPHNIKALDVKQHLFTYKLKEKKSILKSMLFLNPFDRDSQADLKFIQNYYRYIPISMIILITMSFALHVDRHTYGYLENYIPIVFFIVMIIGSNDWRFNIPFLVIMMGINTYFTNIPDGIEIVDFFAIAFMSIVMNFFMIAIFPLMVVWKYKILKMIKGIKK